MKKFIFITLLLISTLFSKTLQLNNLNEIEILSSLDIDPSFINDPKYIKMKNNINQLKTIYFLKALKNGTIFMPNLHELIGESKIPDTFLYMAMVESKFRAKVKSQRNAAGLWQIMPATAKQFKLTVNRTVDERLDPIKSTKVAIKYLQYLHKRFGKWYLAAIAYNCGETKLSRAIKKAQTNELAVLINNKKKYLPKETRNYIRRIIIASLLAHDDEIIAKNNADHLFGSCTNSKLIEVFFNGGTTLRTIARKAGMTVKKIKSCNPHLLRSRLPANKKTYHVYLPQELIANLDKNGQSISKSISIGSFTYKVKKGDTLSKISRKFNNKISAIKRLNPKLKKHLKIGQSITLIGQDKINIIVKKDKPVKTEPEIKTQTNMDIENLPLATIVSDTNDLPIVTSTHNEIDIVKSTSVKANEIFTYFVKDSDSVYSISLKFNNAISSIEELNPGFLDNFKAGMALKIRK